MQLRWNRLQKMHKKQPKDMPKKWRSRRRKVQPSSKSGRKNSRRIKIISNGISSRIWTRAKVSLRSGSRITKRIKEWRASKLGLRMLPKVEEPPQVEELKWVVKACLTSKNGTTNRLKRALSQIRSGKTLSSRVRMTPIRSIIKI